MKRLRVEGCFAVLMLMMSVLCGAQAAPGIATAPGAAAAAAATAPDYSDAASWVCRPGAEDVCTTGLDAMVVYPDGHTEAQPFVAAKNPAIDCFYVYPTVSREQTAFADMTDSPEIRGVTKAQVGRLSSRCRVFAPIYRQATLYQLAHGGGLDFRQPLGDVIAAWNYYVQHDNHGRGVVLIGHSQGTILLQAMIARGIDGKPAQSLLVSAFLAGDPTLGVPPGKAMGGVFQHIPVCSAAAQTGCVWVWGSFAADDTSTNRLFGAVRKDGLVSACANPAAPGGGVGELKFYYSKAPGAPASDPPWVEAVGQLTGECEADALGNQFRVSVVPGAAADVYKAKLKRAMELPGWGLHVLDVAMVQGNMLDVLDAEIAARH